MNKHTSEKKNVLLCVSGSIAAYKAADVASQLVKQGYSVRCLLTDSAKWFVTPTVLETLSHHPVESELFGPTISGTEHITLARWADVVVFAPATAHLIARLALGLADDLVTTVALATDAPWLLAPAMNSVMWEKPVLQGHLETLRSRGVGFIQPGSGVLACGEQGVGKMAVPEVIVEHIIQTLRQTSVQDAPQDLAGVRVLVTAGPTTSAIDAVRYMTNHSTGKMGAALAEEALARGAEVHYVLGIDKGVVRPNAPLGTETRLHLTEVRTAEEMHQAALRDLPEVDGVIATAAVLDYRVEKSAVGKQKRAEDATELRLVPSVDVLAKLREAAPAGTWFVGFAAETDDLETNGRSKLERKKLDLLFVNRVARQNERIETGFGSSTNGGILIRRGKPDLELSVRSKAALATEIWNQIRIEKLNA